MNKGTDGAPAPMLGDHHIAGYAPTVPRKIMKPIRTIDLFAGAGGLTAGFQRASTRFKPVVAVEYEPEAAATYRANHPTARVVNKPIEDWVRSNEFPHADVIIGGPPCQGFSSLGKQEVDDERNFLWEQYAHVMRAVRPKYFVVENVAQFLTSPQFAEFESQTRCGGDLADYDISARAVLNAAHFGAPQARKRTVIIGRHRDMPQVRLPQPTHLLPETWLTVQDAWQGITPRVTKLELPDRWTDLFGDLIRGTFATTDLHVTRNYRQISKERIRTIPYGGNRFDIPLHLQPSCWRRHRSGSGDVMGRLWWERPSVTIRTEFVKPEKGRYLHPEENRAITLHEGARLQGFSDQYLWCGTKTAIAKQIGNAVPIPLGAAIGSVISDSLP